MKWVLMLLAISLDIQKISAQDAPLEFSANGPGKVYAFGQLQEFSNNEMLPPGTPFVLIPFSKKGYRFTGWHQVNVFTFIEITKVSDGFVSSTNVDTIVEKKIIPTVALVREVQPVQILLDVEGVRSITEGIGWQADFRSLKNKL